MAAMAVGIRSSVTEGASRRRLAATLERLPMGRLVSAVPPKVRRAEPLRAAGGSPRSLGPRLAAGDAPAGAKPTTFDLRSGPYLCHGDGLGTSLDIARGG